ncbi:MAG: addiction module protein [Armatimonadota bacterium]
MSDRATQILEDALQLSVCERAAVVERLLTSLDPPDPHIDELWVIEAESRMAAFQAGEMNAVPAEEVFAELDEL